MFRVPVQAGRSTKLDDVRQAEHLPNQRLGRAASLDAASLEDARADGRGRLQVDAPEIGSGQLDAAITDLVGLDHPFAAR